MSAAGPLIDAAASVLGQDVVDQIKETAGIDDEASGFRLRCGTCETRFVPEREEEEDE